MAIPTTKNLLTFLAAVFVLSCCCASDLHTHMTVDELRSTFHVDHHSLVPEYETVEVHHVRRRSIEHQPKHGNTGNGLGDEKSQRKLPSGHKSLEEKTNLRLTAFGKPLDLNLVKTEGLYKKGGLRVWSVEPNATSQHGVEYIEIEQPHDEDIGQTYQDEENLAAVLLRTDLNSGKLIVEGSIGSDIVIKPIPSRLQAKVVVNNATGSSNETDYDDALGANDDEMFLDADGELGSEVAIDTGLPIKRKAKEEAMVQSHKHIVYKRKPEAEDSMSDYALMEPDHLAKRYKRSLNEKKRTKREAPYTIYPEILVIVDYDGYRMHGGDNQQIKRYFVSFWNGVDLRYKLLKGPKIRVSIAGIIISRGRDATPYLEKNRVGTDAIDSAAALTDMGKYLFRERRLPVYDIAVAITKLDMCRRSYPSDSCNRGTAGFAYVGGACVVNKRLEKVNSVAIIEDTGGFSGIIVAAHEVGHLLGAVHDGSPPPSYLGGPGAEKCQWTDGYIMSDLRHTERGFRWSPCSISSFHHFLNGDTATCLYNAPHEDTSLPRVLPGKLLSLDAQCRRDRGTSACFKDDRVCAQLFCFDSSSGYCVAYRPAAEGSPCGDGQYCLNGKCVAEHENIIPDYSQNTPAYVRGNGNVHGRPLFYDDEEQTEKNPYNSPIPPQNYYYQTEDPNYQFNSPTSSPIFNFFTSPTYSPYSFSLSTTRSPYNFENFGLQSTTATVKVQPSTEAQTQQTTKNPYVGNYFQLIKQTTKNPYDFGNFGQRGKGNYNENVNNNYLKRSYNAASYYSDSSNDNKSNTTKSSATRAQSG